MLLEHNRAREFYSGILRAMSIKNKVPRNTITSQQQRQKATTQLTLTIPSKRNNQVAMFSLRPVFKASRLALLVCLVLPSASVVVVAQPQDDDVKYATTTSSLLLTNYNALREEGQGFFLKETAGLFEKPNSVPTSFAAVQWWCDLKFASDDTANNYGYVGRAAEYLS